MLSAQIQPPVRVTRELTAKTIHELKPGVFIVDFGQNFAGTVTIESSRSGRNNGEYPLR